MIFITMVERTINFRKRITVRHMRMLDAIAREQNLGRAAKLLDTSQSALSTALRELEEMLAVSLFDRTTRKLALTPVGELLVSHSIRLLAEIDNTQAEFEALQSGGRGEIAVGVVDGVTPALLAGTELQKQGMGHRIRIRIEEGSAERLCAQLLSDRLDLMVTHLQLPVPSQEFEVDYLYDDVATLAVGWHHPLAKQRQVGWKELENMHWLLPARSDPGRRLIERELMQQGLFASAQVTEASSVGTVLALLDQGNAVTIMPRHAVDWYTKHKLLHPLHIPGLELRGPFGVIRRKGRAETQTSIWMRRALLKAAGTFITSSFSNGQ